MHLNRWVSEDAKKSKKVYACAKDFMRAQAAKKEVANKVTVWHQMFEDRIVEYLQKHGRTVMRIAAREIRRPEGVGKFKFKSFIAKRSKVFKVQPEPCYMYVSHADRFTENLFLTQYA